MIGTHFDAVAADAVARGITGWDVEGGIFLFSGAMPRNRAPTGDTAARGWRTLSNSATCRRTGTGIPSRRRWTTPTGIFA